MHPSNFLSTSMRDSKDLFSFDGRDLTKALAAESSFSHSSEVSCAAVAIGQRGKWGDDVTPQRAFFWCFSGPWCDKLGQVLTQQNKTRQKEDPAKEGEEIGFLTKDSNFLSKKTNGKSEKDSRFLSR